MSAIEKLLLGLRFIGFANGLRTLSFSLQRDWLEWRYGEEPKRADPLWPGDLQECRAIPGGGKFHFQNAELELFFLAPDLVRVTWQPGELPPPYALAGQAWPAVESEFHDTGMVRSVSSEQLEVFVAEDGGLRFLDGSGKVLRTESPPQRQGASWVHRSSLLPQEGIFGLGERTTGLDLHGGRYRVWNMDPDGNYGPGTDPIYLNIPAYLSLKPEGGYFIFYENGHDGEFDFGSVADRIGSTQETAGTETERTQQSKVTFKGGALRYYFIPGGPRHALERFGELVGRAPLPPRWALGFHQSRWGYRTAEDIREVVAGFEQHELPLSAIHLDIDYMVGFRVFTVDEERFPDLPGLVADLARKGVKVVTILDPGVKRDRNYEIYKQGREKDMFCKLPSGGVFHGPVWPGNCAFPDFTDPQVRAWWGEQYDILLDAGVAGIWHDMNEPAVFTAWGMNRLPLAVRHALDGAEGDHGDAHNFYGLLMNRAGYEALRAARPEQRPWLLSRSGWAGLQRYAWNWTGDTETSWAALHMTIGTVLNLGLSGIPYSGPDIGGFSGSPDAELFTRWFQLATFMPFFRNHSAVGTARREPWTFGQPTLDITRKYLNLRRRLLPYLYTLAWEANRWGYPLIRPLFWRHPRETSLWAVDDAFTLGDALLVAPVLEQGARTRSLALPSGYWYDFWGETVYQGPGEVELSAPLERIPLLVRQGAVLPLEERDGLHLHIYPPVEGGGGGALYSDRGEGYGPGRLDEFDLVLAGNALELVWRKQGEYPFPYPQVELHLHGLQAESIWLDGSELTMEIDPLRLERFERVRFEFKARH